MHGCQHLWQSPDVGELHGPSPCAARTPRRSGATCLSAPYRPRGAWSDRSAVKPGNEFLGFPASMIRHSHADHRWWAGGPSLPGDVAASRDARGSERWSNDRNASEQAAIKAASRLPYVLCSHAQGAVERVVLGRARKRRGTARLSPAFLPASWEAIPHARRTRGYACRPALAASPGCRRTTRSFILGRADVWCDGRAQQHDRRVAAGRSKERSVGREAGEVCGHCEVPCSSRDDRVRGGSRARRRCAG